MMSTPPSSQKKRKAKKQGRAISESPSVTRLKGNQKWVPYPFISHLLVPSGKVDHYHYPTANGSLSSSSSGEEVIRSLLSSCTELQPGGVVNTERKVVYAQVTSIDSVHIGDHVPLHSDAVLLHPETMRECEIVIASPVVVRTFDSGSSSSKQVVCKAWPLPQLPLDVAALGNQSMESCAVHETDNVRIGKLQRPSQLPVAGDVWVEPCGKMDFPIGASFQNYLLHMHNGYFVSEGNLIGVQYYGDWRSFRIVRINSLDDETGSSSPLPVKRVNPDQDEAVVQQLSELALDSPTTMKKKEEEEQQRQRAGEGAEFADFGPPDEVPILKITARSKMTVVDPSKKNNKSSRLKVEGGPTLSNFAGSARQVKLLKELVLFPLESPGYHGLLFPHGVLLYGPPGVGKSLLAQALANECTSAQTFQLSAHEALLGGGGGGVSGEGKLEEVFKEARERCPSLIVIDDLHTLCPRYDSGPSENERKLTSSLCSHLDGLLRSPPPSHVVVVATTNQIDGVEPCLRRPGRFDKEVEIPVPTASERREILQMLLRKVKSALTPEQLAEIADSAHGHVGADLYAVFLEAQYLSVQGLIDRQKQCCVDKAESVACDGVVVTYSDVQAALRSVRPSAMREVAIEVPKVYWSDIGGQEEVKERMKEAIEWPLKHPQVFSKLGISPPKGVLLYGPPGCSKTMVARALATESGLNFIAVKGPELFSKWVGDSERAVRQVFTRARAAAPAIIFFDEMDALAVQRKKEGGSSVADRVLAQLLTEMDGVESLRDVLVVAATNRPDMIDKALLRPGRIDRLIYVPLPSDSTRKEIFKIQFKKTPIAEDVDLEVLATLTTGYSGAEVVSLCQEAALSAMHEDILHADCVAWRHFEQALKSVLPRTDLTMIKLYEQYSRK